MNSSNFFYNMGTIVMTQTVKTATEKNSRFAADVSDALVRYFRKDWGEISDEDKKINDDALGHPEDIYIFASYFTCKGEINIITNRKSEVIGDNCTTILFPYER